MDWPTVLKISHIVGTVLGAGGATFAGIFLHSAKEDGVVDDTESRFLQLTYWVLRLGLIVLVVSGFGYLLYFRLSGFEERLYSPRLWAKLILTAILLINAILLQVRAVPLWFGGAISIVSWYSALVLGAWRSMDLSNWTLLILYLVIVSLVALFLRQREMVPTANSPVKPSP